MCGDPSITYSIRLREGKTGSPGEGGEGRRKGGREEGSERGMEEGRREGSGRHGFVIFRRVKLVLWHEEGKISSARKWSGWRRLGRLGGHGRAAAAGRVLKGKGSPAGNVLRERVGEAGLSYIGTALQHSCMGSDSSRGESAFRRGTDTSSACRGRLANPRRCRGRGRGEGSAGGSCLDEGNSGTSTGWKG